MLRLEWIHGELCALELTNWKAVTASVKIMSFTRTHRLLLFVPSLLQVTPVNIHIGQIQGWHTSGPLVWHTFKLHSRSEREKKAERLVRSPGDRSKGSPLHKQLHQPPFPLRLSIRNHNTIEAHSSSVSTTNTSAMRRTHSQKQDKTNSIFLLIIENFVRSPGCSECCCDECNALNICKGNSLCIHLRLTGCRFVCRSRVGLSSERKKRIKRHTKIEAKNAN